MPRNGSKHKKPKLNDLADAARGAAEAEKERQDASERDELKAQVLMLKNRLSVLEAMKAAPPVSTNIKSIKKVVAAKGRSSSTHNEIKNKVQKKEKPAKKAPPTTYEDDGSGEDSGVETAVDVETRHQARMDLFFRAATQMQDIVVKGEPEADPPVAGMVDQETQKSCKDGSSTVSISKGGTTILDRAFREVMKRLKDAGWEKAFSNEPGVLSVRLTDWVKKSMRNRFGKKKSNQDADKPSQAKPKKKANPQKSESSTEFFEDSEEEEEKHFEKRGTKNGKPKQTEPEQEDEEEEEEKKPKRGTKNGKPKQTEPEQEDEEEEEEKKPKRGTKNGRSKQEQEVEAGEVEEEEKPKRGRSKQEQE